MKFKHDIEAEAGFKDKDGQLGSAGQILSSTGTQTDWIDQGDIVAAGATRVLIACKNTSGATITKGTPVYQTGNVGATDVIEIAEADALISTGYLPAIGLLETDLINNALGNVVITGELLNITTDPIDGVTPTVGDTIYLKSGGGLTLTKPTGEGNAIQNLGLVGKVSGGNAGSITVASIMRQNDVPNLTTGKIWVGASNTVESTVVHLDETNNRLGVNQTSPIGAVHIVGPNTNPAMTTSALVVEQGDGAKILIDGNDIDAASGMLYLNDYSTNDVVFGGQIRVGGGGSPVGNSWFANGNVGIGTTSPAQNFVVADATNGNGVELVPGATATIQTYNRGTSTYTNLNIDTLETRVRSIGATVFNNGSGFSEAMRIDSSGNVGIGTTSPGVKLEINGGADAIAKITGTTTAARFDYETNSHHRFWQLIESDGRFRFYDQTNTSERLAIDSSGNVGIGTTSPGTILHIVDGAPTLKLQSSVSSASNTISFDDSLGTQEGSLIYDTGNNTFRLNNASGFSRLNLDNYSATFSVGTSNLNQSGVILGATTVSLISNFSTALTCNYAGNVGIGTTNPTEKLFVNGGNAKIETTGTTYLKLNSNTSFPSVQIQAERQGGTSPPMGQLRWDSNPGATGMQLHYWNGYTENSLKLDGSNFRVINNGSERMRITSTGNVGIGTTTPGEKLEVNGTVKATATTDAYKGYIKSVITTGYSMKSATTAYQYIPYNAYTLTTSQAYYNRTVAAYNGRVKKIIVKRIDGASADATGMKFKKEINGVVIATEYTATVLYGSGNFQATYNFANSDFTFSAGDSIGVLMQSSGGTGMIGAGAIQIVLEYNIT